MNKENNKYALQTIDLYKDLQADEMTIPVLRGVSINVEHGQSVGIIGTSGSGKSTLLGLIGGLDVPTSGQVIVDGLDISSLTGKKLNFVRNEKMGFVFQSFNLIPTLTALENVALPIHYAQNSPYNPEKRAEELLELFGLEDRLHHYPSQLSGGQQQRVAIARSLANNPSLLLADEPTGNLDSESSENILKHILNVQQEMDTTVIIVTHDMKLASQMDIVLRLVDGNIHNHVHE